MSQTTTTNNTNAPVKQESPWREHVRDFFGSRLAVFGLVVAALLILAAILAPWITPQNPYDLMQLDVMDARLTPGTMNGLDTFRYVLGTDGQGRDVLASIVYGATAPSPRPAPGRASPRRASGRSTGKIRTSSVNRNTPRAQTGRRARRCRAC